MIKVLQDYYNAHRRCTAKIDQVNSYPFDMIKFGNTPTKYGVNVNLIILTV